MMMKIFSIILLLLFIFPATLHAAVEKKRDHKSFKSKKNKEGVVRSEVGLNIPEWGVAIDAIYDARLDKIIPGYHIINIVLTNRRGEPIILDVMKDKWIITDNSGGKHRTFNHVKHFSKALWKKLPDKLKTMVDYPQKVSTGKSITIDVFLPDSVDLFNFKEIVWKSAYLRKEFNVFTNYESNLSVNEKGGREFELPKPISKFKSNPKIFDKKIKEVEDLSQPKKYTNQNDTDPEITDISDITELDDDNPKFDPNLDKDFLTD